MAKKLFFIIIMATIILNCNNESRIYKSLCLADSLLQKEENDSALNVLKKINTYEMNDSSDIAYYNLLHTQTLYRLYMPIKSDSSISISIRYYEKKTDKEKLARAYYYKGAILYEAKRKEEATALFKRGKYIATEINDKTLMHNFEEYLTHVNLKSGNYKTALKHAYEALNISSALGKKDFIAEDLDRICVVFSEIGDENKVEHYVMKMVKYISHAPKILQPRLYTNISIYYFNKGNFTKAEEYINKSLTISHTSRAYYVLGSILKEQGKEAEAWALWNKAIHTDNIALKAEVMQWMADYKKEKGEYREASLFADSISILKDSLKRMQKAETIMQIQKDIEKDDADHRAYIRTRLIAAAAVALVIVLMAFGIYHARRMSKAKSAIAENQKLVDRYTEDLERLAKSNKTNEREINRLNRKISELRDRNSEILGNGRKLWDEIMAGNTTAKWHKADFEAVVEHVRTKHPDVVAGIENRYSKLTPGGVLYLLLAAEGMDDEGIQHAMNLSPGALRTMKYRMKKNETANNEL